LCFFFGGSAFFLVVAVVGVVAAAVCVELVCEAAAPPQPATANAAAIVISDLFMGTIRVLLEAFRGQVTRAPTGHPATVRGHCRCQNRARPGGSKDVRGASL
jgi:hypothetical protein